MATGAGCVHAARKVAGSRAAAAALGGISSRPATSRRWLHNGTNARVGGRALGFTRFEYGLEWFPTKEALLQSNPGPVLVGTSYEFEPGVWSRGGGGRADANGLRSARKYGAFPNHFKFWELIETHLELEKPQNLHEVLPVSAPRCLYFDLDGDVKYKALHTDIVGWLSKYVRWFFNGDRLGWQAHDADPVVLTSSDPGKYSCHVVFPQIQFSNYGMQQEYMEVLLNALPALQVQLQGGESVPILNLVVDRAPYTQFQLLRGPWACKLSGGKFRPETQLEPESHFRQDPLSCFASRVDTHYKLKLPPVDKLLDWNEELQHYHETQLQRIRAVHREPGYVSPQDLANLYMPDFQQRGGGIIDLSGLPPVELFEVALEYIHPLRASQWWSWFRICGVTYSMLERHKGNTMAMRRIWKAHEKWSSKYALYDGQDNFDQVMKSEGRRVSGIGLLHKLVAFDNPDAEVRSRLA